MPLYIGALAKRTGLARSTLRYYERIGLLAPSARTSAGYRVFSDRTLVELTFVRRAQALGFTLSEVREVLRLYRRGASPCERVVATAKRRLAAVERELERLSAFHNLLAAQIADWTACGTESALDGPCALIECASGSCEIDEAIPAPAPAAAARSTLPPGRRRVHRYRLIGRG